MKKLTILIILITLAGFAFSQSVEIKDSADQILLKVNDEGTDKSSITIPLSGTVPDILSNKLYNLNGSLKWSGSTLATGSSLWTLDGSNVYRNSGNVGIGTTNPLSKLSVIASSGHDAAIYGISTDESVHGVMGEAEAINSRGVFGRASGTNSKGVVGYASGEGGVGVVGTSDNGNGVFGGAGVTQGSGVYGEAHGSMGFGIKGLAHGVTGHGVYGQAIHASGINYGVRGKTESPNGWAGYFEGRGYFSGNVGIGTTSPASKLSVGGVGMTWATISGVAVVSGGVGVFGQSTDTGDGFNVGGVFMANGIHGTGVYGEIGNAGKAVHGRAWNAEINGGFGGYFESEGIYGVGAQCFGYGISGTGVAGLATNTNAVANYGGKFEADGTNGRGVYGYATHATGTNYGVHGITNSPAGWAGYFEGRGYFSGNVGIGTTSPNSKLSIVGLSEYADNTAALAASLAVGDLYRTGDLLKIVH